MSKLTSIEWLIENCLSEYGKTMCHQKIKQAKEMHKQEIMDAYATVITKYDGVKSWTKIYDEEAESYYNENYCDDKKSNEQSKQQKLF